MREPMGVSIPSNQRRNTQEKVPPGKVVGVLPVEYVAVQYGNEFGVLVKEIWLKAGDDFFRAPDAEMFVSRLKTVKQGHADQVKALLKQTERARAVRVEDRVDIISKQTAEDVQKEQVDV